LVPLALRSSTFTASCKHPGERWAYRCVIVMVLWPVSLDIVKISTTFIANQEPKVCRRSCHRKFLIPTVSRNFSQLFGKSLRCVPGRFPGKTKGESIRRTIDLKTSITVAFMGTVRPSPLLDSRTDIHSMFDLKSLLDFLSLVCFRPLKNPEECSGK
jgi:hypothetical protein